MPTIKSVQRGTLTIKDKTTAITNIIAVDISKSDLSWSGMATDKDYGGYYHAFITFTDTTTLTASKSLLSKQEYIYWEITEYV